MPRLEGYHFKLFKFKDELFTYFIHINPIAKICCTLLLELDQFYFFFISRMFGFILTLWNIIEEWKDQNILRRFLVIGIWSINLQVSEVFHYWIIIGNKIGPLWIHQNFICIFFYSRKWKIMAFQNRLHLLQFAHHFQKILKSLNVIWKDNYFWKQLLVINEKNLLLFLILFLEFYPTTIKL